MTFKLAIKESRAFTLMLLSGLAIAIWGTLDSLDSKFFYTSDEAAEFLTSLSAQQLKVYFWTEYVDLIFIVGYSLWFFKRSQALFPQNGKLQIAAFVPGIFDAIETVTILILLSMPVFVYVPNWLGFVTALKWVTGTFVAVCLINGYRKSRSKS